MLTNESAHLDVPEDSLFWNTNWARKRKSRVHGNRIELSATMLTKFREISTSFQKSWRFTCKYNSRSLLGKESESSGVQTTFTCFEIVSIYFDSLSAFRSPTWIPFIEPPVSVDWFQFYSSMASIVFWSVLTADLVIFIVVMVWMAFTTERSSFNWPLPVFMTLVITGAVAGLAELTWGEHKVKKRLTKSELQEVAKQLLEITATLAQQAANFSPMDQKVSSKLIGQLIGKLTRQFEPNLVL